MLAPSSVAPRSAPLKRTNQVHLDVTDNVFSQRAQRAMAVAFFKEFGHDGARSGARVWRFSIHEEGTLEKHVAKYIRAISHWCAAKTADADELVLVGGRAGRRLPMQMKIKDLFAAGELKHRMKLRLVRSRIYQKADQELIKKLINTNRELIKIYDDRMLEIYKEMS